MATTTNLLLALIAGSQNNKEITLNTAMDGLDKAMCAANTEAMSDADYTLSPADAAGNVFLKFTGTLTANRNIILPSGMAKFWIVINDTSDSPLVSLTFKVGTGAVTVAIADLDAHLIYSDGVNTVTKVVS